MKQYIHPMGTGISTSDSNYQIKKISVMKNVLLVKITYSLVDGGALRTFLCDPMHTLRSSGYTLSGKYIDDLSWSPRTKLPENAFLHPFFDVIHISIKHSRLWGRGKVLLKIRHFPGLRYIWLPFFH